MSVLLTVLLATMSIAGVAAAVTSWHGSDYAEDISQSQQVRACDRENDGNSVYASYQRNGSGHIERTGKRRFPWCVESGKGAKIYRLRVCEDYGWPRGARCGNNVYP